MSEQTGKIAENDPIYRLKMKAKVVKGIHLPTQDLLVVSPDFLAATDEMWKILEEIQKLPHHHGMEIMSAIQGYKAVREKEVG